MRGEPSAAAAPELGLRRVCWVRVTLDPGGARYEAVGVSHRRPATRVITPSTALALASRGVPVVTAGPVREAG